MVVVSLPLPLCSPNVLFVWTNECHCAFEAAKSIPFGTPVLAAPNFTLPFKLEVDASVSGAGEDTLAMLLTLQHF